MTKESPLHRYYKPKVGHWSGRLRLEVTDPDYLKTLGFMARQSVMTMARSSQSFSPPTMTTSVDCSGLDSRNEVIHTTKLSNFGLLLYSSIERIRPELDGRSFRLEGREQYFPFLGSATPWFAHGTIESEFDGAEYHIPWLGATMVQNTRMTEQGLEIIQTTPFSKAVVMLHFKKALTAGV